MGNPSTSRKVAKVDSFDSLPDELLTHILSFLPFKEAVRAACLGRRWRYRWLQLRHIDLDESLFTLVQKRKQLVADGRHFLAQGLRLTGRWHFVDFVSRFVARFAEPKVECFRLVFSNPKDYGSEVREWLRAAVDRGVETLVLDFSDPEDDDPIDDHYGCFDLPEEVYGLQLSLRTLALTSCDVQLERFGALHGLRILCLSRIVVNRDYVEKLTASLPLLEELYLDHLAETDEVTITGASRLRVLDIIDCDPMVYGVRFSQAPMLQLFRYRGFTVVFEVEQATSLKEVELQFPGDDALDASDLLRDLLVNLKMVVKLTVCSSLLQVIPFGDDAWRLPNTMDKLRHLTLSGVTLSMDEIQGMSLLMRSYPHLESLTIILNNGQKRSSVLVHPCNHAIDAAGFWEEQLIAPIACLRNHLQYVSVEGFTGQINQLDFMEFILGAARGLREVHIYVSQKSSMFGQTMEQRMNMANNLLHCSRASEDVKITIE